MLERICSRDTLVKVKQKHLLNEIEPGFRYLSASHTYNISFFFIVALFNLLLNELPKSIRLICLFRVHSYELVEDLL